MPSMSPRAALFGTLAWGLGGPGALGCEGGAGDPSGSAESCAELEAASVESVQAAVRVLENTPSDGYPITPLAPSFVTNESGAYWHDGAGAVFALRRGQARAELLRPGLDPGNTATRRRVMYGLAASAERVYVGEAELETGAVDFFPAPEFEPPGRLVSLPAAGGNPVVLLELADALVAPVAAEGGRLIVFVEGPSGGFHELDEATGRLERLAIEPRFFSGRRSGESLFVPDDQYPATLLRSSFDEPESELVVPLEDNNYFAVGPGYVLTRRERLTEPEYALEVTLVQHQLGSGCSRPLPPVLGESVSQEVAADSEHVYWISRGTADTGASAAAKLVRADLSRGGLEHVLLPGVALDGPALLRGQDAETLYLSMADTLLVVEKP